MYICIVQFFFCFSVAHLFLPLSLAGSRSRIDKIILNIRLDLHHRVSPTLYPLSAISVYVSVHLSIYRPIYLSIHLSANLFINLSVYLSIYLAIYLSTHLSINLSLSIYLSICRICVYTFSNSSLFCFTLQRYSSQRAEGMSSPVCATFFSFLSLFFFFYFHLL